MKTSKSANINDESGHRERERKSEKDRERARECLLKKKRMPSMQSAWMWRQRRDDLECGEGNTRAEQGDKTYLRRTDGTHSLTHSLSIYVWIFALQRILLIDWLTILTWTCVKYFTLIIIIKFITKGLRFAYFFFALSSAALRFSLWCEHSKRASNKTTNETNKKKQPGIKLKMRNGGASTAKQPEPMKLFS